MADMIQIRRDTAANWTSANPTLAQGELGIETNTSKLKSGNGTTVWNSLGYLIDTGSYITATSTNTLTNKTWNSNAIGAAYGGTGLTAVGTSGNVLKSNGSVWVSSPEQSDAGGTVTSIGVVGGSTGLTTSGGPITTSGNITLAGTLVPANGGTGATSLAANNVILGNGTSAVQVVAPGTSGNVLKSNGSTWTSAAEAAGYPAPSLISANTTATSATFQVAIAGGITITLPSSPSAGDFVVVKDGTGAAATTNFTVARNGSNIASSATDLVFDKNFAEIVMTYINGTIGWSV